MKSRINGLIPGSVNRSTGHPKEFRQFVFGSDQLEVADATSEICDQIDIRIRTLLAFGCGPKYPKPDDSMATTALGEAILIKLNHVERSLLTTSVVN